MVESFLTFKLNGQIDAKGSGYEAGIEQTLTGVQWTLRGNLAKAVSRTIQAAVEDERERCAQVAEARKALYSEAGKLVCSEVASSIRSAAEEKEA